MALLFEARVFQGRVRASHVGIRDGWIREVVIGIQVYRYSGQSNIYEAWATLRMEGTEMLETDSHL